MTTAQQIAAPSWALFVDPGLMTGWAFWDPNTSAVPLSGQHSMFTFLALAELMMEKAGEHAVLVIEKYTITAATVKKSPQHEALKIIGALEYLAYKEAIAPPTFQLPSQALSLITDARLKALGWYRPGNVHANDALRHAAYWAVQRKLVTLAV